MSKLLLIVFTSIVLISCIETKNNTNTNGNREFIPDHDANPVLTTAEKIAYKHGLEDWKSVSELRFTFNVDRGENHFERSFIWHPKTSDVVYMNSTDTVSYNRKAATLDSIAIQADRAFVNDSYWLLAPFKLVWDEGISFSEEENVIAPISKDTLNKLTITYGNEGGYTPGDAYDIYYANDYSVKEWAFRKGNDKAPTMLTSWKKYKTFNGITLATMHRDSTNNFKLYFTNISVK